MKYGQYDNPANLKEHPERKQESRTLAVLCSYIPKDEISQYNTRSYVDDSYKRYKHNRLECLKFVLACYEHYQAGANYDLLIVDNDSPSENAKRFILDQECLNYIRLNTFYSFGAYKSAWEN